jgi:HSP20 family molecular chaperone IbpA
MAVSYRGMHGTESPFASLYYLLKSFENYAIQNSPFSNTKETEMDLWHPKFELGEASDSYKLYGELPGLRKDNLCVEFTHPQTLLVRGKFEFPPTNDHTRVSRGESGAAKGAKANLKEPLASTTNENSAHTSQQLSEEDLKAVGEESSDSKIIHSLRDWRRGEFSRTFNFSVPIAPDAATATLRDGILTVFVPKAKDTTYMHHFVNIG